MWDGNSWIGDDDIGYETEGGLDGKRSLKKSEDKRDRGVRNL